MQIDLRCPVENQGVTVRTNSQTGEAYALFKLFNLSNCVISGVTFVVRAYDAYGGELGEIHVELQDLEAQPKSYFAETKAVSLKEFEEAKHITADFLEVQFSDGESYVKSGDTTEIEMIEPDYDEKIRLISAAGEDAQCYAKDAGPYWICVCGRPNQDGLDHCVRCGREKAEVFAKFSSRDAITKTIEDIEEAERLAKEQEAEEKRQAALERSRKRKKVALMSAGTLAALVVLFFLINLAYSGIMTLLGNSAQKQGDYLKAYSRYAAVNNSGKIAEVSEKVRGNSSTNVMQTGYLTSDEENIYYIDLSYAIYKESKATGEKTRLADAEGVFLNAYGGWVYYVDAGTGKQICRVKADGSETEIMYESDEALFYYLNLVGNELYFVAQEPKDDLTPEMQEAMAQQQNTNPYQIRLYRMRVGEKKPVRVSEKDITIYTCYKDRIYFLDQTEQAIYSMNRKGKDVKKLVSGPVYIFTLHNDLLYYVDGTTNDATGMPKLSLEVADLEGNYKETKIADKMVIAYGHDGEDIYYQDYMDETGALRKIGADGDIEIATFCQSFNVWDGYVMYLDANSQFMKTTFDKSGVEPVLMAGEELAPTEEVPAEETPAEEVPAE